MTNQLWTKERQKEHRQKWIVALCSKKYKQAKGVLNDGKGGYCCLGVGCELIKDELSLTIGIYKNSDNNMIGISYNDEGGILPYIVKKYYGLQYNNGSYIKGCLSNDNDKKRYDFNKIADIIESEPEGLVE